MIGILRHKISLYREVLAPDAGGGAVAEWVVAAQLWARVVRLASTQDFLGDRRRRLKRITATIRARTDIDTGMRIFFSGALYEITSIESGDAREQRLTLVCEEVAL